MDKIVIFGTGKISDVVSQCIEDTGLFSIVGYTCEKQFLPESLQFRSKPVVDFRTVGKQFSHDDFKMFVAVGYHELNQVRARICAEAKRKGYQLVSVIHPGSGTFSDLEYGENCFIMNNVNVQPAVRLGNDVFVWSGALVGHHSQIGNNCWITSGANIAGSVNVGDSCFFGADATIGNDLKIGSKCFFGANTLVTKDISIGSVFIEPSTNRFRLNSSQFLKITNLN